MGEASQLIGHLKYCRQRASAIGVLGLAALLAWRALPKAENATADLQQAYAVEQQFMSQKENLAKLREELTDWVAKVPREQIHRNSYIVSNAGSSLERLGLSANGAAFFTTTSRIDRVLQSTEDLSKNPLLTDPAAWSRKQIDAIATLLG